MEMIFKCNEKPVLDDKPSVLEKSKTINLNLPTFDESKLICANACMKNCNHIKAWFKCNHTMCIESAKYCGYCIECGETPEKKVVIRVKSTRIKQLELLDKKNKQLEEQNQVFSGGYKRTLDQLNIERMEKTNLKLDLIRAEDKIKELNKVIERLLSKMDDLKLEISDVDSDVEEDEFEVKWMISEDE
jgi:hypothetical protein